MAQQNQPLKQASLPEIDIVFSLADDSKYPGRLFGWSFDGGKRWRKHEAYDSFAIMIRNKINHFIVDKVKLPQSGRKGEVCYRCRNEGFLEFMRFDRLEYGIEEECRVWYEGDMEVSGDVEFFVVYRIEKCERCGNEWSDYA